VPHARDIEAQIPELMRTARVPGLSLAVFVRGKFVWLRGFGVRDRASGIPVDVETLFEAASTSKPLPERFVHRNKIIGIRIEARANAVEVAERGKEFE
jgi:hypothetical protein